MAHEATAKLRASSLIQAMWFERIRCLAKCQSQCPINAQAGRVATLTLFLSEQTLLFETGKLGLHGNSG
jgi:hypothetical protein